MSRQLFRLGMMIATPGVLDQYQNANLAGLIQRHSCGDWGDLSDFDKQQNQNALEEGERIFSSYHMPDGGKVWIITEADRSSTTILLPEDY